LEKIDFKKKKKIAPQPSTPRPFNFHNKMTFSDSLAARDDQATQQAAIPLLFQTY
jgi:hypothetical protein